MNYKKLLVWIDKFLKLSDVENLVLKTWIYRDNVAVIDFLYKGSKFAFDIKIGDKGLLDLFLVDRNDNIAFLYKGVFDSRVKLANKIKLKELGKALSENILGVKASLDDKYKYKVSVVIPVHNRESIIRKCIESLNNQTFDKQNFEVVFVDDCSTDKSVTAIHSLVDENLNYTVIERSVGSGSASTPRNDGVRIAQGKYVFFMDSDDYISDKCLARAYEFAEENSSDVVYLKIGSDDKNPRGVPVRAFKSGNVKRADVANNHLLRSNFVFRFYRSSFLEREAIKFDPIISVSEDKLYTVMVLSKTKRISILAEENFVYITRHDGEHLSRKVVDLQIDLYLYLAAYNWIFISKLDFDCKNKIYNGWTIKVIERLKGVIKSNRYSHSEKYQYFQQVLMYLNFGIYHIDKKYIYKEFHILLDSLLERNYQKFEELVLKS